MKFDFSDKSDKRIVQTSPSAMNYPGDVDKAPDNAGVYMFIDVNDDVIYVGSLRQPTKDRDQVQERPRR